MLSIKKPERRYHSGAFIINFEQISHIYLLFSFFTLNMAWVFSCKFAAYLQNTFSKEYLWRAASDVREHLESNF